MQDFEKIAAMQEVVKSAQSKEAVVNFIAGAIPKILKWTAKNPMKTLGVAANTYFVGDAAAAGARSAGKNLARGAM